jgi:hypothetical protein
MSSSWLDVLSQFGSVQFSLVVSQALAPSFLLTAVVAFLTLLTNRLWRAVDALRYLEGMALEARPRHFSDAMRRLARRARLLYWAIRAVIAAGIGIAVVILIVFLNAVAGMSREWGASLLFVVAIALFACALICLLIEIGISLHDFETRLATSDQDDQVC